MKKEQTVREHIEATLASFDDVVFTDDVVSILVARCEAKGNSTLGFAHNVARNWAIDHRRCEHGCANATCESKSGC